MYSPSGALGHISWTLTTIDAAKTTNTEASEHAGIYD